ncbi:hypothetical protein OH492_05730 [Vibrio chagasii]|nr:hypothetical protein [Vibrio chagasii]
MAAAEAAGNHLFGLRFSGGWTCSNSSLHFIFLGNAVVAHWRQIDRNDVCSLFYRVFAKIGVFTGFVRGFQSRFSSYVSTE